MQVAQGINPRVGLRLFELETVKDALLMQREAAVSIPASGHQVAASSGLKLEEIERRFADATAILSGETPAPTALKQEAAVAKATLRGEAPELLAEHAGREITLEDGSLAIEMHVSVNGQIIRAVLSDASFDMSMQDQDSYAKELGGRLATREEHHAVVRYLLEKEEKGTLNTAESKLLESYRGNFVIDLESALGVNGDRVYDSRYVAVDFPFRGALVVLPLANQNKTTAPTAPKQDTTQPQSTSPVRPEYSTVFDDGTFSKLESRPGIHGKLELRFTLKGGLANLEAACAKINDQIKSARNYPKEGFAVYLSGNDYQNLSRNEDVIVEFTPVIDNSGVRTRYGDDPSKSHDALRKSLRLEEVPNDIARLAAGAFRKEAGFPTKREDICTTNDGGDIFEGKVARTAKGSHSGAVSSDRDGVGTHEWRGDGAHDGLVLAAASPRNQKI